MLTNGLVVRSTSLVLPGAKSILRSLSKIRQHHEARKITDSPLFQRDLSRREFEFPRFDFDNSGPLVSVGAYRDCLAAFAWRLADTQDGHAHAVPVKKAAA